MSGLGRKYTVYIYILLLLVILSAGCGRTADKKHKTEATDWPKEVSYCVSSFPNIAFSGNRELYVEDDIMHIRDMESDVSAVLCTRANCNHLSHSATSGSSHCEAASPPVAFGDFEMVALHGDTVFQFFITETDDDTHLYISHIGKSGRKKAAAIPYRLKEHLYFEGNKLYFMGMHEDLSEDGIKRVGIHYDLLAMDLDTYELTRLAEYSSKDYLEIVKLDYSNGILAYERFYKRGDLYYSKIFLYNTKTKKEQVLDSYEFCLEELALSCVYIGYRDGFIYYTSKDADELRRADVETGKEECVFSLKKGKVLTNCSMNNMGIQYKISDPDTLNEWDSDDKRMYYRSFEDGKTYSVKQKYTKMSGVLGVLSKDTAYYHELKDDKFKIKRMPLEEYLDKEEN